MKQKTILTIGLLFSVVFYTNAQKQCPGITVVGSGYDIFDEYANNKSVTEPLFNFNEYSSKPMDDGQEYKVPGLLRLKYINEKDYKTTEGSSLRQYATSMSVGLGLGVDGLVFSGSVDTRFGKEKSGKESNYFYTITDWTRVWEVYINPLKDDLRSYLTADAKNAIDTWPADKLFDIFGTHYVSSGYFGGAMEFNLSESFSSASEAKSIAVSVQAQYQAVSASADFSLDKSQVNENFKSNVKVYARGGDVQYANKSSAGDNSQYNEWVKTIPVKAVLIDFKKGSLVPLWELADNQTRKNELKSAFTKKLAQYPLPEGNSASTMMMNQTFYVKSKSNGQYWDLIGYHFNAHTKGKLLLAGKDVNPEGKQGGDRFFKVIPHATENEYVFFQAQHANEVIVVGNGTKDPGMWYHLWDFGTNNASEMFKMIEADEPNTYLIQNKNSGLYFTEKGGQITQEAKTGDDNQKWVFEEAPASEMAPPPAWSVYHIASKKSGLFMDVKGAGGSGAAVQLYNSNGNNAQAFQLIPIDGAFSIIPLHKKGAAMDMHPGDGQALRIWDRNSSGSQKFVFVWAGVPRTYKIKLQIGEYITADKNFVSSPGCKLNSLRLGGADVQDWVMHLTSTVAIRNKYISGGNAFLHSNNGNIMTTQVDHNGSNAKWTMEWTDGFINLRNAQDGTLLNIETGSLKSTKIGGGSWSSQWIFEEVQGDYQYFRIKNRWKGTYLNTEGGTMNCGIVDPDWQSARWELHYK